MPTSQHEGSETDHVLGVIIWKPSLIVSYPRWSLYTRGGPRNGNLETKLLVESVANSLQTIHQLLQRPLRALQPGHEEFDEATRIF
jgi:hypothetical protein